MIFRPFLKRIFHNRTVTWIFFLALHKRHGLLHYVSAKGELYVRCNDVRCNGYRSTWKA